MIVDKSDGGRARLVEDDINHDSKAEYKMDVDIPPSTRPKSRMGKRGICIQTHVRM
jgi:hypothetical protein